MVDYVKLIEARYNWVKVIACHPYGTGDGATVVMTDYGNPDLWMVANVDGDGALFDSCDELSRERALDLFEEEAA